MKIEKSERFKKQIKNLKCKYQKIHEDIKDLKSELPKLAFRELGKTNYKLCSIKVNKAETKEIWKIRISCSDNNRGKSAGYRIFYCKLTSDKEVFLLGIFIKKDIEGENVEKIAKQLVEASRDAILASN